MGGEGGGGERKRTDARNYNYVQRTTRVNLHVLGEWGFCSVLVNMVLNVHRNHEAYCGRGEGGGWGRSWKGEGGIIHTYRYTVTSRMTPALRWAATRAISMFH